MAKSKVTKKHKAVKARVPEKTIQEILAPMSVVKLKAYARKNGVVVPATLKDKAGIANWIFKNLESRRVANISPGPVVPRKNIGNRSQGMPPTGDHATRVRSVEPHLRSAGFEVPDAARQKVEEDAIQQVRDDAKKKAEDTARESRRRANRRQENLDETKRQKKLAAKKRAEEKAQRQKEEENRRRQPVPEVKEPGTIEH